MSTAVNPVSLQKQTSDLCSGPFFKKILTYTLPIILTGLLQLLFNAADLIVVGRCCGNQALSAVGATGSLVNLLVNLFTGLSVGAGVCVAQGTGARNEEAVHRTVHTAIPAACIGGVLLTFVGITFSPQMLELMATPEDVIDLSALYLRIYFAGIIPILLYNFGGSILRAAGDTRSPLLFLSIAGVINVVLNLAFVILLDLNVAGVALATTLSQLVACILVLRALHRRTDACRLYFRKLRIHKSALARIVRIGLPAGLQGSLFSVSNVMIQSSINSFGTLVLSGSTAAANIEGFVYVSMNSFHQTAMNFVGQNVGARKYENLGKILRICLCSVACTGLLLGGLCYLCSEPLLSIYLKDDAEAIVYGVIRMLYVCVPYFLCGLMDVMSGILRGMGASISPMLITVIGICGTRLCWIYTIFRTEAFHTLEMLFLSYSISWALTFLSLFCCFFFLRKRLPAAKPS